MIECRECGFKAPDKVIDNFSITICPNCNLPLFNLEEEKEKALEMAKSLGLDITAVREEFEEQKKSATQEGSSPATSMTTDQPSETPAVSNLGATGTVRGLTRKQYDEFIEELGEKEEKDGK